MRGREVTVVLGEMDVTQVNPYRSGQGKPPVHMAWLAPNRQSAVTDYWGGGGRSSACFSVDNVHQARITEVVVVGDGG